MRIKYICVIKYHRKKRGLRLPCASSLFYNDIKRNTALI